MITTFTFIVSPNNTIMVINRCLFLAVIARTKKTAQKPTHNHFEMVYCVLIFDQRHSIVQKHNTNTFYSHKSTALCEWWIQILFFIVAGTSAFYHRPIPNRNNHLHHFRSVAFSSLFFPPFFKLFPLKCMGQWRKKESSFKRVESDLINDKVKRIDLSLSEWRVHSFFFIIFVFVFLRRFSERMFTYACKPPHDSTPRTTVKWFSKPIFYCTYLHSLQ